MCSIDEDRYFFAIDFSTTQTVSFNIFRRTGKFAFFNNGSAGRVMFEGACHRIPEPVAEPPKF